MAIQNKPCQACAYCGLDISEMNFYCANAEAVKLARGDKLGYPEMWLNVSDNPRGNENSCGKEGKYFKQHTGRNENGSLK